MKTKLTPQQAFTQHFGQIYGPRWEALEKALLLDPRKEVLRNPFGMEDYSLDAASVLPVEALDLRPGDEIADLCASPGGKTLAGVFKLKGEARWFCNDLSPARVTRLNSVLHDCLPAEVLKNIQVTRGDASRWGMNPDRQFDKILVDAPCSGERHLLQSAKEIARWSLKGSQRLAVRQHALLCSALDCVRPGGRVVYSTCSISPIENDGVIAKLQKSRKGLFQVLPLNFALGEATELGWIVLPDRFECGPIYFSALEKLPLSNGE